MTATRKGVWEAAYGSAFAIEWMEHRRVQGHEPSPPYLEVIRDRAKSAAAYAVDSLNLTAAEEP